MFDSTNDLNPYLAPGERVLWQGQGKRRMNSSAMGGYLFIAVFVAIALIFGVLFATLSSSSPGARSSDTVFFIFMAIIFLAVGLGVGVPWVLLSSRARNARYFVTNSSAIVVYSPATGMGKRVVVVALKNLQQLTLSENRDGTGTLSLVSSPNNAYGRYSTSWLADSVPTFANIEQPLEVYQLIRKQMDALTTR